VLDQCSRRGRVDQGHSDGPAIVGSDALDAIKSPRWEALAGGTLDDDPAATRVVLNEWCIHRPTGSDQHYVANRPTVAGRGTAHVG
jgi:hypothetical protein